MKCMNCSEEMLTVLKLKNSISFLYYSLYIYDLLFIGNISFDQTNTQLMSTINGASNKLMATNLQSCVYN